MKQTKLIRTRYIFLSFIIISTFFSCSDSTPNIARVYYTLVYDFTEDNLPPQTRLSVFIETLSDSRRIKEIAIYQKDADYTWIIDNPVLIKDSDIHYFGYHDIVFPPNTEALEGSYEVRFYDLAMRSASAYFVLQKLPSLKDSKTDSLTVSGFRSKAFASECSNEQIVVYDILDNVLYTGSRTIEIDTDERLLDVYPSAVSYRLFYKNQSNSTVIILPRVQLLERSDTVIEEEAYE